MSWDLYPAHRQGSDMLLSPSITSQNGSKPKHWKQLTHNQSSHSFTKKSSVNMESLRKSPATEVLNLSMNSSRLWLMSTRSVTSKQPPITHKEMVKPNKSIVFSKTYYRRSHHQRKETGITTFKAPSMWPGYQSMNPPNSHPQSCYMATNSDNPMMIRIRRYKKSAPSHMLIRSSPKYKKSTHRPANSSKRHKIDKKLTMISWNILWNHWRLETGSNSIKI